MLYHISSKSGLKVLKPHVSTHGLAYVYATKNKVTGLFFGARKDDFDLKMYTENHHPVIYECYPDALKKIYQYKSCSIYEVFEDGFLRGKTSWDEELVCSTDVQILHEQIIEDLYIEILHQESLGNFTLHRYSTSEHYQNLIKNHILDRIVRFQLSENILNTDPRFLIYFKEWIDDAKTGGLL